MKRTCKQCGKEFELSQSEIQFYKSKNLNIPKRCKECREKNKQRQQGQEKLEVQSDVGDGKAQATNYRRSKSLFIVIMAMLVAIVIGLLCMHQFREKILLTDSSYSSEKTAGPVSDSVDVSFRNEELLNEHYQKHGKAMGFSSAKRYEKAAQSVVKNKKSLHKIEAEDGDDVYYLKSTNEFVVVSTDGCIRTYFKPEDGIDYYNRQ